MSNPLGKLRVAELALGAVLLTLLGISLLPLGDDYFRQRLIGVVAGHSGYQLEIEGDLTTELSLAPGFAATQLVLREKDGDTSYHVRRLTLGVSLMSLLFSEPEIQYLSVEGLEFDFAGLDTAVPLSTLSTRPDSFVIPRFKRIDLRDILVRFDDQTILLLKDWQAHQPLGGEQLQLDGHGKLADRDYRIHATLGPLEELVRPDAPYPIDASFEYRGISLSLRGEVEQPLREGGLNAKITAQVPDMAGTLAQFGLTTPALGSLQAQARLTGSLTRPALLDFSAALTREDTLSLQASGSIANLLAIDDDVIAIGGYNNDPELLDWLMPQSLAGIRDWKVQGNLHLHPRVLQIEDLEVQGDDPEGLTVKLSGSGLLEDIAASQPFSKLDLLVDFIATDAAAARPLLGDAFPELGPIKGRLRLTSTSPDSLSIEDADITVGVEAPVSLMARGRIAQIPMARDAQVSGIDLRVELAANNSTNLKEPFGIELPAIAPVRLTGRFTGSMAESSLSELALQAGGRGQLQLGANGSIAFDDFSSNEYVRDVSLQVTFSAPTTEAIANFVGRELPEVGPAEGRFKLFGGQKRLKASGIRLQAGKKGGLSLAATGEIGNVKVERRLDLSGVRMQLNLSAPATDTLEPFLGFVPPNLGPLQGRARLIDQDGSLGLEDAAIFIGQPNKPIMTATGQIDDVTKINQISWQIHMDLGTDETLSTLLGRPLPDLGRLQGDIELSDADGSLGIEKIEIVSDQEDLLNVRINGLFDDLRQTDRLDVKLEVATRDLKVIGLLLGQDWPNSKPASLKGRLKADKKIGSFDGTFMVGQTKIMANVRGDLSKQRPAFNGQIAAKELYLTDFGLPETAPEQTDIESKKKSPKKASEGKLFSDAPLTLDWLHAFELALQIKADEVIGTGAKLDSFVIPVEIKQSALKVTPATFVYEQGVFLVDYLLDGRPKTPRLGLKMTADDVGLGPALSHTGAPVPVDGSLNINVDLSSTGRSAAEIASNVSGIIELGMENMLIPKHTVDLLAVDLFGWAINTTFFGRRRESRLDCGIVRAKVNQGRIGTEILFFDGPTLAISGEGNLDLSKETIDLSLYPKRKKRMWSKVSPVNIAGSLANPSVRAISSPAGHVAGYAGLALAPHVFIPVKALGFLGDLFSRDPGKGKNSSCLAYTEKAK